MSLLPNFLITGMRGSFSAWLSSFGRLAFIQRKSGGTILLLLSAAQLLLGGGFFPPLIGIIGGWLDQINKSLSGKPSGLTRFTARLWPWPLVILVAWLLGQFPVGAFFNDFLKSIVVFGLLLILVMLPLSVSVIAHTRMMPLENPEGTFHRLLYGKKIRVCFSH